MKPRTRDNLIYLSVGLAIVAGSVIYMFYTERITGTIKAIPGPIIWGIFSTPVIVALILERFWSYRRRPMLWAILIVVALINVSAVVAACSWHWDPPAIIWGLITGVLMIPVLVAVDKLISAKRPSR